MTSFDEFFEHNKIDVFHINVFHVFMKNTQINILRWNHISNDDMITKIQFDLDHDVFTIFRTQTRWVMRSCNAFCRAFNDLLKTGMSGDALNTEALKRSVVMSRDKLTHREVPIYFL